MNHLRDEIEAAMARYSTEAAELRQRLAVLDGKISTLVDVLGTIDELAASEVTNINVNAVSQMRPFGTGRAPRRDVQGCIKQAIRDYMEAKGLGPRLGDIVIGAGLLLGDDDLKESAVRRALAGLIDKGELATHDGRYAPPGPTITVSAPSVETYSVHVTPPKIVIPMDAAK